MWCLLTAQKNKQAIVPQLFFIKHLTSPKNLSPRLSLCIGEGGTELNNPMIQLVLPTPFLAGKRAAGRFSQKEMAGDCARTESM